MPTYYVTLDYHGAPAYGTFVVAPDKETAERDAKLEAWLNGWDEEVKKVTVRDER